MDVRVTGKAVCSVLPPAWLKMYILGDVWINSGMMSSINIDWKQHSE